MACTSLPATRVRVHASIAIAIAEDVAIYIGLVNDHISMAGAGRRHMHGAGKRANERRSRSPELACPRELQHAALQLVPVPVGGTYT